ALEVVRRWSPDVIVLDAMMPRMDGCEFARSYRRLPGPHAPIIALTAAGDGPARAAAMHAASFVGKPFDPDELLRLAGHYAAPAYGRAGPPRGAPSPPAWGTAARRSGPSGRTLPSPPAGAPVHVGYPCRAPPRMRRLVVRPPPALAQPRRLVRYV